MTNSLGYFEQIPVIDLSQEDAEAASALRHACENFGFFYGTLTNFTCAEYCCPIKYACLHRCRQSGAKIPGLLQFSQMQKLLRRAYDAAQWLITASAKSS